MTDIFISYARSTAREAHEVSEALRVLGYGVWRDDELPAHRAYAEVIEERLKAAKAVVVIWSEEATKSAWVQSEADMAREHHKLVQLSVDRARLPMPFDRIQCADLADWSGDVNAPGWRKVLSSIADLTGDSAATPAVVAALPTLPSKPSVAVAPFANLSNDPDQDYFVEGMVEDIVSALAHFKSLFVISAGSSLVAGGEAVSPQEAARQLGVDYVLEGSVRKAGQRVRVVLHLVDARNGAEVWTDRLDDTLDDIFALQDRVAERVAGVVEPTLRDEGVRRAAARPTTNMGGYDLYLRAEALFRLSRREEMLQSIEMLDRAIEMDPDFAAAMSQSCVCHRQVVDHGWCDDIEAFRQRGLALADRALRIANDDSRVLAQVAAALPGLEGGMDRAIALSERAKALNPASSFAWLISGSIQVRNGEPDLAAEHLETSMRLDPISTMNAFARMYLAMARFQQARFEDALTLFRSTMLRLPVSFLVLAALHGHLGRRAAGLEALAQFHDLTAGGVEHYADIWFRGPGQRERLLEGLVRLDADDA